MSADFKVRANGSLTTNFVRSFDESSPDIVINDTATTFDIELNTIHPMKPWNDRSWSLVTILGATSLLGEARGELGFNDFFEAGHAVQFDIVTSVSSAYKMRLGVKAIAGPEVSGWALVLGRGI
jgi:hypothetical protein